jgi:hypothetical protein
MTVISTFSLRLKTMERAMAQAVSRRPLTAEDRVRSQVGPCGICGGQSGTGIGFSPSTSVFPCQFHSTGATLQGKTKKTNLLQHRVAQESSRLRCVSSICFGALHTQKKAQNHAHLATGRAAVTAIPCKKAKECTEHRNACFQRRAI